MVTQLCFHRDLNLDIEYDVFYVYLELLVPSVSICLKIARNLELS